MASVESKLESFTQNNETDSKILILEEPPLYERCMWVKSAEIL